MKKIERLGVDFGNTIVRVTKPAGSVRELARNDIHGAMDTLLMLAERRFGSQVYVVSKVSPGGAERVLDWMERNDFYRRTGIPRDQVHFCAERHEKGPIALRLGLTHFIDDRAEVMAHMPESVGCRILFDPDLEEYTNFRDRTGSVELVTVWGQIRTMLIAS